MKRLELIQPLNKLRNLELIMNRFFSLHAVVAAATLFCATSLLAADGPQGKGPRKPGANPYVVQSGPNAGLALQSSKARQATNLGDTATHERMGKLKTGTTVAPSAWYAKFDGIRKSETELRKRIDKATPVRK